MLGCWEHLRKSFAGEDQATLDLVARLSGGDGRRNLRQRTTSTALDEPPLKKLRLRRSVLVSQAKWRGARGYRRRERRRGTTHCDWAKG